MWYFGNDLTRGEGDLTTDVTQYLKLTEAAELRDLHESWGQISLLIL